MIESPGLTSRPAKIPSAMAWAAHSMLGAIIATSVALVVYVVIGLISWAAVRGYEGICLCAAMGLAAGVVLRGPGPDPPGSLAAGWGQLSPGTPPCRQARCSRRRRCNGLSPGPPIRLQLATPITALADERPFLEPRWAPRTRSRWAPRTRSVPRAATAALPAGIGHEIRRSFTPAANSLRGSGRRRGVKCCFRVPRGSNATPGCHPRSAAATFAQRGVGTGFAGLASSGRASHTFTVRSQLAEASRWPSRAERHAQDRVGVPRRVRVSCPVRRPTPSPSYPAGGGEPLAVGAERHALDPAGVPLEGEGFLAGRGVPHLHRLIVAGGGEPLAVGAERHAVDIRCVP